MKHANYLSSNLREVAIAIMVGTLASTAYASSTWNFASAGGCTQTVATGPGDTDNRGNSWACSGSNSGPTATVTAWAGTTTTNFTSAEVAQFSTSGFGVRNTTSGGVDYSSSGGQHSMDNNGKTDLLLFYFGGAQVSIDEVKFGWTSNDSDFTLLAYTGAGTPSKTDVATTLSNSDIASGTGGLTHTSTGWSLVNHFSNVGTGTTNVTPVGLNPDGTAKANDTYSSWWIVSAYNAGYGGSTSFGSSDYLKLLQVSGQLKPSGGGNGVPEPGSLALIGTAFLGLLATRRRFNNRGLKQTLV